MARSLIIHVSGSGESIVSEELEFRTVDRRTDDARVDLSAAFRWAARFGWNEAVGNHFSFAISDDGATFLMNPKGRHFARVRASDLLVLDAADPAASERADAPDPTAWAIHGAIHRNCPHARCVLHLHPKYATVLATLQDSAIPPLENMGMRFFGRVQIDDGFRGMGLGDEAERISAALGNAAVLMMGNHGVTVVGPTVAQTFDDLYHLERACEIVVAAYSTGKALRVVSDEVAALTAQQWQNEYGFYAQAHFSELKAILDEEEPDYRR